MAKVNVGIIGVTGYAGEELLKILSKHPGVKITYLSAKLDKYPQKISDFFADIREEIEIEELNLEKAKNVCDLVFLALPHGVSLEIVSALYNSGKKVIDLSADYRLNNPKVYEKWYQKKHTHLDLLKKAVYGLPELYRKELKAKSQEQNKSCLIANPGCYPTGAILACAPALKENLVEPESIIIDSKSGISGGGREFVQIYYPENKNNFKAYNITVHRHQPEIEQELSKLQRRAKSPASPKESDTRPLRSHRTGGGNSERGVKVTFVPHLLPVERGILSTIYLTLKKKISEKKIRSLYSEFYLDEPFVRVLTEGKFTELKNVVRTNYCEINFKLDEVAGRLVVISAIDNLVKGAAGQAVQNMNLICGYDEKTGLI